MGPTDDWHATDAVLAARGEYLGQVKASASVAPPRLGFIVREGNADQLCLAMTTASQLWGGVHAPILSVSEDGNIGEGWLRVATALEPDFLIDLASPEGSSWNDASNSPWLIARYRPDHSPLGTAPHQYVAYSDRLRITAWLPEVPSVINLAGAGTLTMAESTAWQKAGSTVYDNNDAVRMALAQLGGMTVLATTAHADDVYYAAMPFLSSMALLWLADDTNETPWLDVLAFWNLRASRPGTGVSVLTTEAVARDHRFQERLRSAVAASSTSDVQLAISSESIADGRLRQLANDMGIAVFEGVAITETIGSPPLSNPPDVLQAAINLDLRNNWECARLRGSKTDFVAQAHRPVTKYVVDSPVDWYPPLRYRGRVAFSLSGDFIRGPRRPAVARLYEPNAAWSHGALRWLTSPVPRYDFSVTLPTGHEILAAALTEVGLRSRPGDKARHVDGVLAAIEGDRRLAVHKLFGEVAAVMTGMPGRDLLHALEAYVDAGLPAELADDLLQHAAFARLPERSYLDLKSLLTPGLRAEIPMFLDRMVACGLIQRGLRSDCQTCGLSEFVEFSHAAPAPRCGGCGSRTGYAPSAIGEPELRYRLNSLLHLLSLNGGVPPLQATIVLRDKGAHVQHGAVILDSETEYGELDLLGWQGDRLFTGEAKSTPAEFSSEQAEKDCRLATQVKADKHYVVCPIPISEIQLAEYRAPFDAAGIELVELCGDELRP